MSGGLLAGGAVDRFAQQVGVAVVPGVLLDHVDDDPAQARRPAVGPRAAAPRDPCRRRPAPRRSAPGTARRPPATARRAAPGCRRPPCATPSRGRRPSPRRSTAAASLVAVQRAGEPAVLDQGQVLEQAAEGHRRDADRRPHPGGVQSRALPGQRGALEVQEAEQGGGLVAVDRRFGAALLVELRRRSLEVAARRLDQHLAELLLAHPALAQHRQHVVADVGEVPVRLRPAGTPRAPSAPGK